MFCYYKIDITPWIQHSKRKLYSAGGRTWTTVAIVSVIISSLSLFLSKSLTILISIIFLKIFISAKNCLQLYIIILAVYVCMFYFERVFMSLNSKSMRILGIFRRKQTYKPIKLIII